MKREQSLVILLAEWHDLHERGDDAGARALVAAHPEIRAQVAAAGMLVRGLAGRPQSEAAPGRPKTIGDFRILAELGRGGMGVVYDAEQISLKRRVALKVLSLTIGSNPDAAKRFEREARAAARLHHTNIVPVYSMGRHEGHWYYAMERIEGRTLADLITELRADREGEGRAHRAGSTTAFGTGVSSGTTRDSNSWFAQLALKFADLADALQLAHREGIIHRDVKPSNLLLDTAGELRIVDFGLALQMDDSIPAMTNTGQLLGTPMYMSPEQALAQRGGVDHRTDIYSLGATLYELLTLAPPFDGTTIGDLCAQIATRDPALPRRRNKHVPRDLETIVLKAMEKDRERRYASAAQFAADLRAYAAGRSLGARRVGPMERCWRRAKRHKVRSALVVCVLILAGLGVWLAWQSSTAEQARRGLAYDRLIARAQETSGFQLGRNRHASADRPAATRVLLDQAVELLPERSTAYWLRALVTGDLKDVERARARGIPKRTYHITRAYLLARARRNDEAGEERRRAEQAGPPSAEDAYFEARLNYRGGKRKQALRLLDLAIDGSTRESSVRYLALRQRAGILLREGKVRRALEDLSRLLEGGDETISARVQIASAWRRLGDVEDAEERFGEVLAVVQALDQVESWRALAQACHRARENAWGLRATEAAVAAQPQDARLKNMRMWAFFRAGRNKQGVERARAILAQDPENHGAWECLGQGLMLLGSLKEAAGALAHACETDPECAQAQRASGHLYLRTGHLDDALAAYKRAIALRPGFVDAWIQKGIVLKQQGETEQARAAYEHAIRLDPSNSSAYINRGALLADVLDKPAEALHDFELACKLTPGELTAHINRALVLERLERYKEAEAAYACACELDPKRAPIHVSRWKLLRRLGRAEALRGVLESVAEKHADDPRFLHVRGHAFLELQQLEQAEQCFAAGRKSGRRGRCICMDHAYVLRNQGRAWDALPIYDELLRRRPDADVLVERARTYLALNQAAAARADLESALAIDANAREAHLVLGVLLLSRNEDEQALAALERAHALGLDHPVLHEQRAEAWRRKGLALWRLHKTGAARAAFDRALAENPQLAQAYVDRGALRNDDLQDPRGALKDFAAALALDADLIQAHRNMGIVHGKLGQLDLADAAWSEAILRAPEDPRLRMGRGLLRLERAGRTQEALADFSAALEMKPLIPSLHLQRARALRKMDKPDAALAALDAMLVLLPNGMRAHYERADIHLEQGQTTEALAGFEKARSIRPDRLQTHLGVLHVLMLTGRAEDVLAAIQQARSSCAGSILLTRLEVQALRALGRSEQAGKAARAGLEEEGASLAGVHAAYLRAALGDKAGALQLLDAGEGAPHAEAMVDRARVHAVLGQLEAALDWLERAADAGYRRPAAAAPDRDFDALRQTARYAAIQARFSAPRGG